MILDFEKIEEQRIPHFKDGEGDTLARMYFDGLNRIMRGRLEPGCSIGLHTHDTSSEVIFITKGHGSVLYDGEMLPVQEGSCHYCPKGHSHSLINNSEADLEFSAVVPQQ